MNTTARVGDWLRTLPPADAAAVVDAVLAAAAALPALAPGVRCILPNMLYRLTRDRYRVAFGVVADHPVIVYGETRIAGTKGRKR